MKAWAEVGTHGKLRYLEFASSSHPQCQGKLAIFISKQDAIREAGDNIREVTITVHRNNRKQRGMR